jgi:hypothetical protein
VHAWTWLRSLATVALASGGLAAVVVVLDLLHRVSQ